MTQDAQLLTDNSGAIMSAAIQQVRDGEDPREVMDGMIAATALFLAWLERHMPDVDLDDLKMISTQRYHEFLGVFSNPDMPEEILSTLHEGITDACYGEQKSRRRKKRT